MSIAKLFHQPSMMVLALLVVGLVLVIRQGRLARVGVWALAVGAGLYFVLAFSPVPRLLLLPLEERFSKPANMSALPAPKGIIVLGGAVTSKITRRRRLIALNDAAERFTVAAALAHRYPKTVLLVSNGGVHRIDHADPYGYAEYRFFEELGIARDRIIYERHSSNTYENAVMGKSVAKPKAGENWLLVTSAAHMPRAVGVFRKAGFPVTPWPVDYRTAGTGDTYRFFTRPSDGLRMSDAAANEWFGLLYYWVTGRTRTLFPRAADQAASSVPPRSG